MLNCHNCDLIHVYEFEKFRILNLQFRILNLQFIILNQYLCTFEFKNAEL